MPRPTIPERRTALLDAAEATILRTGFDALRIADLAREVGVGKGAVYLEFDSKDAILQALLVRATARMTAHSRRVIDATQDADLSLALLYRAGVEALLAEPLAVAALLDDRGVLGRTVDALGPARYAARVDWVRTLLRTFADQDALAPGLDVEGLAVALSSATLGLLSASAAFGPLTAEQLSRALDSLTLLVERGTAAGGVRDAAELRRTLTWIYDQVDAQTAD